MSDDHDTVGEAGAWPVHPDTTSDAQFFIYHGEGWPYSLRGALRPQTLAPLPAVTQGLEDAQRPPRASAMPTQSPVVQDQRHAVQAVHVRDCPLPTRGGVCTCGAIDAQVFAEPAIDPAQLGEGHYPDEED